MRRNTAVIAYIAHAEAGRDIISQASAEGRVARAEVLNWRDAALELAATKAMAGFWRESRDAAEKGRA